MGIIIFVAGVVGMFILVDIRHNYVVDKSAKVIDYTQNFYVWVILVGFVLIAGVFLYIWGFVENRKRIKN